MTDFARLETHNGLQVLAYVEDRTNEDTGKSGPCLVRRCDPSISVTTTLGPYPDNEEGWGAAEAAMKKNGHGCIRRGMREAGRKFLRHIGGHPQ